MFASLEDRFKHVEMENQVLRRQAGELFPILHNTLQENKLLRQLIAAPAGQIDYAHIPNYRGGLIAGGYDTGGPDQFQPLDKHYWLRYAICFLLGALLVFIATGTMLPGWMNYYSSPAYTTGLPMLGIPTAMPMGVMEGGIVPVIFKVLLWILVAATAIFYVRWLIETVTVSGNKETSGQNGALAIATERFARGEITREEYLEIKQELS